MYLDCEILQNNLLLQDSRALILFWYCKKGFEEALDFLKKYLSIVEKEPEILRC